MRRSNRPESAPSGCTPWVGIANQSDHHTVPRQAPRAKGGRPIEGMVWMRTADKSDCTGAKNTPPLPCATLPLNMSCNMWDGPGCFRLPSLRKACRLQPLRLGSQERLVRFKDFVADHAQGRVKPRSTASLFSTSSCQRAGGHLATRYPLHRSARARKNSSEKNRRTNRCSTEDFVAAGSGLFPGVVSGRTPLSARVLQREGRKAPSLGARTCAAPLGCRPNPASRAGDLRPPGRIGPYHLLTQFACSPPRCRGSSHVPHHGRSLIRSESKNTARAAV